MPSDKKVFPAYDAAPGVIYAHRVDGEEAAYPVLANTAGSLQVTGIEIEAKLATIDATLSTLSNLISQMQGIASDMRVTILSGAVTSVTTLSNQTQIGGQPATNIVQNTMDNLAVVGNVQNIAEN